MITIKVKIKCSNNLLVYKKINNIPVIVVNYGIHNYCKKKNIYTYFNQSFLLQYMRII